MNVRKHVKKVVALGTGFSMIGATLFGAAAVDLGGFPAPYIKEGKFDGLMVIGEKAKTDDVLGIVDIATSLQYASKVDKIISGTTTTSLTGDVYQIGTSSDMLELGETLGEVKSTITGDDMAALAPKRMRTSKGSTDADQYLKFGTAADSLRVVYEKNKNNRVGDFLKADNNAYLFTYELQFPEGLKSATYEEIGSTKKVDSGTAYMNDIHDEDLYILGDTFNIVEAQIRNNSRLTLTLMGGALIDTLNEGESKTYQLEDKMYELNVLIIADASNNRARVKFMINGEVTKSMNEGDTETLEDGTVIGVKSILANEGAEKNGFDIVSFYLGANKIELTDNDYTDSSYDNNVEVDENKIDDAEVMIQATWINEEAKITSISYKLKADSKQSGDLYIDVEDGLRNMIDEPEGLLSRVWDVQYFGLTEPETTNVELVASGDESYYLDFTNQEDIQYSIPFVDNSNEEGFGWKLGTEEEKFVFVESSSCLNYTNAVIALDDYFVVSLAGDDKAFTHVLSFDNVDNNDGILSFSDIGDGSNKEVTFTKFTAAGCADTSTDLIVGGESYAMRVCTDNPGSDENYKVCVDLDGDGDPADSDKTTLTTYGGVILSFPNNWFWNETGAYSINQNGSISHDVNVDVTVLGKYTDDGVAQTFTFSVQDIGSNEVDLDYFVNPAIGLTKESEKNEDIDKGMTRYGIYVEEEDEGVNDADSLLLKIPDEQVFAQVYVTGGESTSSKASEGKVISEYTRIEVGKAVLDTEVGDMTADNLLVVGGPCVNTVAAFLLDIPSTQPECYENFPVQEGQGIIKMVEQGQKVATIVAGFSAPDTRKAAQILANYEDYVDDLLGKDEVIVSGNQIMSVEVIEDSGETEE